VWRIFIEVQCGIERSFLALLLKRHACAAAICAN
jgi:hypothetical protein